MTYQQPEAAYSKIKSYLKKGLASGRWLPGALTPSESDLVKRFGVSRMTASRAVRELVAEGLLERIQGLGTFAIQPYRASSTLTIRDLHAEIAERGRKHHAEVHCARKERVSPQLSKRMGLPSGSSVFHTLIVHSEDGVALLCEDRYVNPSFAPDYLTVDFTQTTPTQYLLSVAPLWEAHYFIEAGMPTAEEADLLGIDPREACLVIARRTESQGVSITLARLVHPGFRYAIQGSFTS